MTEIITCPEAGRLQDLLDGNLPDEQQAGLNSHLESCRKCQERLESLAAGKETWTGVARNLNAGAETPEAGLQRVMAESKKEVSVEPEAPAAEVPLDFLSPPEDPAHLGRLGQYEVIEVVSRGGMSVVLKAFDANLHRVVAIKVLAPQLATTAAARTRFRREGFAAAAISHEHVVAVYGVDEINGLPYLVMEYIAGESLQERLDRDGPLELKEILRIGIQTAQGLAAAHAQGLVHRDIKPANILLHNGVARVKITDFGLARAVDDATLTQSGFVAGTPQYMSPEQARGDAIDHRTDLFSLGSVLYAMCTGRPPFRGSTTMGVLKRVSDDRPRAVREINPEVPPWLAEIIAQLHAKNPAERFQSAAEVAEVLGKHLAALQQASPSAAAVMSVPAPAPAAPPRRSGLFRKRPWAIAAALLPVLAGMFVVSEATGVTNVTEFVATVLRIHTPHGTLVIETDDPGVEVALDGGVVRIHDAGPKEIRVTTGEHRIRATKDGKEVQVDQELVTVTRGSKTIVRIRLETRAGAAKQARSADLVRLFLGHTGPVSQAAFSPDGKRILSGSGWPEGDATIRLWDVATGKELRRFQPKSGMTGAWSGDRANEVNSVAISADGRRALSGGVGAEVILWDLETGKEIRRFSGHTGTIWAVCFSPDGRRALSGSIDHTVRLWDVDSGRQIRVFLGHTAWVHSVCFAPDGGRALSGSRDKTARLWDVDTGRELRIYGDNPTWVETAVFTPDGRKALLGTGTIMRLLEVDSGKELHRLQGARWITNVAVSRDGRWALSANAKFTVQLWDLTAGREIHRFEGHRNIVRSVAFAPDGQHALSAGGGISTDGGFAAGDDFAIRFWTLPTEPSAAANPAVNPQGQPAVPKTDPAGAEGVDGKTSAKTVREIATLTGLGGHIWSLAFAPDGKTLVASGGGRGAAPKPTGEIKLWDTATRKELWSAKGPAVIHAVAFSPGGTTLATGDADGTVRLREAYKGWQLEDFRGHNGPVFSVAFAPNGQTLASGGLDNIVRIWRLGTKQLLESFRVDSIESIRCLAFSRDGETLAVAGRDQRESAGVHGVRLFDVGSWRVRAVLSGHKEMIEQLAFSPDGKLLATASADKTVKLWHGVTGKELATLKANAPIGKIRCLAFSPNGTVLATGGDNQPVHLWDVTRRGIRDALGGHGRVVSIAFSPDGRTLAFAGADGRINLWDVAGAYPTTVP